MRRRALFQWGVLFFMISILGCQKKFSISEYQRVAVVRSIVVGVDQIQPNMAYWGNFMVQFIDQLQADVPIDIESALMFHTHPVFQQLPEDDLPEKSVLIPPFRLINLQDSFYATFLSEALSVDAISGVNIVLDLIKDTSSSLEQKKIVSEIVLNLVDKHGNSVQLKGNGVSSSFQPDKKGVGVTPHLTESLMIATMALQKQLQALL